MLSDRTRRFACTAVLLTLAGGVAPVNAAAIKTEHVTAELVAAQGGVQPGQTVQIGLSLKHIPHWHTYWRNPGDSGLPTTVTWTVPAGARVGEIEWPAPKRLPIGPLVNYGYEGELLLPMRLTAPSDARAGDMLKLRAQATWLVCKDVCVPESAELELQLPVLADAAAPTVEAPRFAQAAASHAQPLAGWRAEVQQAGRELLLTLTRNPGTGSAALPPVEVFPYTEQLIDPARHEVFRSADAYAVRFRLLDNATPPAAFAGIAVAGAAPAWGGTHQAVEFNAPWRQVAAITLPVGAQALDASAATASPSGAAPPAANGASLGLLAALALAFVGGMVLNLMPCVFPVLSIKLLGLTGQTTEPRQLRTHALAYSAGVIGSFVGLAALLLALRGAGSAIGWGFQLQSPGVVFVLALLFFSIGLNLIGAFEFGNLAPQRLAAWRSKRPAGDAFVCGMLAVVAASPCTAPFMGAALGFAITQPTGPALAIFAALGLGMALPYVVLVLLPGWRRALPRPGEWMLHLKQGLAFPMFATVVWLLWVLGLQAGIDAAARVLLALVGLAFVAWLAGLKPLRGGAARIGALVVLLGLLGWSWPGGLVSDTGPTASARAGSVEARWAPYDETALSRLVADGKPVFVDFTAAWCVSCQVNKRIVLHTDSTMQAFADAGVILMRADWTRRDAVIGAALARYGRSGVPVYVLIRPGREPMLLPEILTGRAVTDALATL